MSQDPHMAVVTTAAFMAEAMTQGEGILHLGSVALPI